MSEEEGEFHFSPRPNRAAEINWRPWSEKAFEEARQLNRPILLSISAVWCHWCHVMEETTYRDPKVVALPDGSKTWAFKKDEKGNPIPADTYKVQLDKDKNPVKDATGKIETFTGWVDPNYKPETGATPFPDCWTNAFANSGSSEFSK